MTRYGMTINLDRCVGCHACSVSCAINHGLPKDVRWSSVKEAEAGTFPSVESVSLPTLCMHCKRPLCLASCPTGATYQTEEGIVLIDQETCIGCGTCVQACPYGARHLVGELRGNHDDGALTAFEEHVYAAHKASTAEKCTFCVDRLENGEQPACVATCQAHARLFGDLDDPTSDVAVAAADKRARTPLAGENTEPSVLYLYSGSIDLDNLLVS